MTGTEKRNLSDAGQEDSGGLTPIDMDTSREKTPVAADASPPEIITWLDQQSE